ncbi:MAG TPA: hypothetical protein ENN30_02800, partial [Candidatus Woesearchaeota archaeon]|nr:hypothetical protein [Candidatus Woesearchaeota archaeon]
MKKIYAYLLVALIFTVIASAQPPSWVQEKQAQKGGENEAKVIYEQKNGVDWEFVGALVAIFAGTAAVIG